MFVCLPRHGTERKVSFLGVKLTILHMLFLPACKKHCLTCYLSGFFSNINPYNRKPNLNFTNVLLQAINVSGKVLTPAFLHLLKNLKVNCLAVSFQT